MKSKVVLFAFVLLCATAVYAWHLEGYVYCDVNGNGVLDSEDEPIEGIFWTIESTDGKGFYDTEISSSSGRFLQTLPDEPASYIMYVDPASLPPGATVIYPEGGVIEFTVGNGNPDTFEIDWLIDCDGTQVPDGCWLTGGGSKFSNITYSNLCESGPKHSFGGNVFASGDPDPGMGGNWNHIAHSAKLHFHGTNIDEVECGNVDDHEPGSESPVTPHNYIEFSGFGTLKGIKGNKDDFGKVYFFARCEDRAEPGSKGAKKAGDVDRYFLHVFSDPSDPHGTTLLLVDMDGNSTTVDPVEVTGGNLQLHDS